MSLQILLDDQLFGDAADWDTIQTSITRDSETDALLIYQDFPLTYYGEVYDYFTELKNKYGFCMEVSIEIVDANSSGFATVQRCRGTIFLSDCEFYESERKVVVKVVDKSYYAAIKNNKSIKTEGSSGISKNNLDIDPITPFVLSAYDIQNIGQKEVYAIRVYDAFRYLVEFMTDGKVGFISDSFEYGGELDHFVITSMDKLSSIDPDFYGSPPLPSFSFDTLFNEIKKRIPIAFTIQDPYGSPVLRLEKQSYFYGKPSSVKFENIDQIITKFDTSKLYAIVKFGTKTIDKDNGVYFPEDIFFLGFKEEEYHVLGTCNIDKTLDLSCEWITSSNVIDQAVRLDNADFNGQLVLLDVVLTSKYAGRTKNTNFLSLDPIIDDHIYFYNEYFTNYNIAKRYLGFIPNSVAAFFGPKGNGLFKASQNPNSTLYVNTGPDVIVPYTYGATEYNNAGYYDAGTGKYTPGLPGIFDFEINFRINVSQLYGTGLVYWYMRLLQYDSTNTLINAYYPLKNGNLFVPAGVDGSGNPVPDRYYYSFGQLGTFDLLGRQRVVMNQGDYVVVEFDKSPFAGDVDYTFLQEFTNWSCVNNTTEGGVVQEYDNADYPIEQYNFDIPMTREKFEQIVANPSASFEFFSDPELSRYAWIESLVYNYHTCSLEAKLFTDRNSSINGNRIPS